MLRTVLACIRSPHRCRSVLTNAELSPTSTSLAVATVPHGLELGAYLEHLRLEGGHPVSSSDVSAPRRAWTRRSRSPAAAAAAAHRGEGRSDGRRVLRDVDRAAARRRHLFVGEIGEDRKPDFFASAAATLFPINWPEPFGIVMIESLAAGTPVIALRNGSVPEILRDGVTGFICDSADELGDAVARLDEIDPDECRRHAREFTTEVM